MTTEHEEPEEVHHADEHADVERQPAEDKNQKNIDNDASPETAPHFSQDSPKDHYSAAAEAEEPEAKQQFQQEHHSEFPAAADTKREETQVEDGAVDNHDGKIRHANGDEGVSSDDRGAEEPHQTSTDGGEENREIATNETKPELINLFVRNVAKHVMEPQLVDLFSKFGKVDSAVVVRDPHSRECRGFGFVKMCTEEGANGAIAELQEFDFEGRKISVERAKRSAPHSRTPGAYMGIDRRIRDRYVGMKRHRDYDTGRYPPYPPAYDMRGGGGYRGRYYDPNRPRAEERSFDYRMPYPNQPVDDRDRLRRRYNNDAPRFPPSREFEREQRFKEREPPVPRESADDYI